MVPFRITTELFQDFNILTKCSLLIGFYNLDQIIIVHESFTRELFSKILHLFHSLALFLKLLWIFVKILGFRVMPGFFSQPHFNYFFSRFHAEKRYQNTKINPFFNTHVTPK